MTLGITLGDGLMCYRLWIGNRWLGCLMMILLLLLFIYNLLPFQDDKVVIFIYLYLIKLYMNYTVWSWAGKQIFYKKK